MPKNEMRKELEDLMISKKKDISDYNVFYNLQS